MHVGVTGGVDVATATAARSIYDVIRARAEHDRDRVALLAPGDEPLTNAGLLEQVHAVGAALGPAAGASRVAVLMPNGADLAAAILGVAAWAACAPLNPALTAHELDFAFDDLRITHAIVATALAGPVLDVARSRRVRVIEATPTARASRFTLGSTSACPDRWRGADDLALLLHTSGTVARPKIVPLLHRHLCLSAGHVQATLGLTSSDRGLNVMPLFHIHGIVAAILAPMVSGGDVAFARRFAPAEFFELLDTMHPTWYSAGPAIHQAIAREAARHPDVRSTSTLRVIRSSSAALPTTVLADLEEAFGAPVLEGYGMTEAALPITSNPRPPAIRKPGSVGLPAGPTITIVNAAGRVLAHGQTGEIALRGETICEGYERNPDANRDAFVDGWFRTGDIGYFDADGYLYISGRVKEIINRAGEKVSPREVEEALLRHPDVVDAAVFGVPHPTLGEDVAGVIVVREQATSTPERIRGFARTFLADFKAPAQLLIVEEIPKSPTGKLQRARVAATFRNRLRAPYVEPRTENERALARIWGGVLGVGGVGALDNFFQLGGDSIQAMTVCSQARAKRLVFDAAQFGDHPTLAQLAEVARPLAAIADGRTGAAPAGYYPLLPLQREFLTGTQTAATVLQARRPLNRGLLRHAASALVTHHDALRLRIVDGPDGPQQHIRRDSAPASILHIDLSRVAPAERLAAYRRQLPSPLAWSATAGPIMHVVHADLGVDGALVVVLVHHAAADRMSMDILGEDLQTAYDQLASGNAVTLPEPTTSVGEWATYRSETTATKLFADDLHLDAVRETPPIRADHAAGLEPCYRRLLVHGALMRGVWESARSWRLQPSTIFAAAFARAWGSHLGRERVAYSYLLSGRRDVPRPMDLSRTVGCLAVPAPLVVDTAVRAPFAVCARRLQASVDELAVRGERCAWLADRDPRWRRTSRALVRFNYTSVRPMVSGDRETWSGDSPYLSALTNRLPMPRNTFGAPPAHSADGFVRHLIVEVRVNTTHCWIRFGGIGLAPSTVETILLAMRGQLQAACAPLEGETASCVASREKV